MNSSPLPVRISDLVLRVGAQGLEHLAERTVVLNAELDRPIERVRGGDHHTVVALQVEEVPKRLAIVLELGGRDELLQRHLSSFLALLGPALV